MPNRLPLEHTVKRKGQLDGKHDFLIQIDFATLDDVDEMKQVHRFGRINGDADITPHYAWARFANNDYYDKWAANLFSESKVVLKASVLGAVVGFAVAGEADCGEGYDDLSKECPKLCELHQLYVVQGYQRTGIGGHLYRELAAEMKERGFENMAINLLLGNAVASGFYSAMGAVTVCQVKETKTNEPGQDSIEIVCELMNQQLSNLIV
jgi:GNAT superfamily N-acetyltransferase